MLTNTVPVDSNLIGLDNLSEVAAELRARLLERIRGVEGRDAVVEPAKPVNSNQMYSRRCSRNPLACP